MVWVLGSLGGLLWCLSDILFMVETFYPARQRCKTCRKKFNADGIILDGLFCSYGCAGVVSPSSNVDDAPRHCKRSLDGVWGWKTKYVHEGAVPQRLRDDPATNVYRCSYCHFLHVGHDRPVDFGSEKLRRTVRDMKTLGSVVKRYREQRQIDKKVLAKVLNIPVVRITEIENGDKNVSVHILFVVLNKLDLMVELTGR